MKPRVLTQSGKDLNDPPTAVAGIIAVCAKLSKCVDALDSGDRLHTPHTLISKGNETKPFDLGSR